MTSRSRGRRSRSSSGGTGLKRRGILAGLAGGITLVASQTSALTTVDAGRGTVIGATDDGSALLGIEGKGPDQTPTFTNRFPATIEITLTAPYDSSAVFDVGDTGNWQDPPVTVSIASGSSQVVDMNAGVTEITVDISGTYQGGSFHAERVFEIPQSNQVLITPAVRPVGNSGKFQFGLRNEGSIDAYMTSIRIDSTTTTADRVASGDIFEISSSENPDEDPRQLVSDTLWVDDTTPGSEPLRSFDDGDQVELNQASDEVVFDFDRFQNGNQKIGMKDESVYVTVGFADGSHRTFDLEP